jgi:hypothetical protein
MKEMDRTDGRFAITRKFETTYESGSINAQYDWRDLRVEEKKWCLKGGWIKLSEELS